MEQWLRVEEARALREEARLEREELRRIYVGVFPTSASINLQARIALPAP